MEEGSAKGRPLDLDWNKLLPTHDDGPPSPVVVINTCTKTIVSITEPQRTSHRDVDPRAEDLRLLTDHQLTDSYNSKLRTFENTAKNLPDKGDKLRVTLKHYEDELSRRRRRRLEKEVDECEESRTATTSTIIDVSDGSRQENLPSEAQSKSSFASIFFKKIEDIDCGTPNTSKKESLSKHCDSQNTRDNFVRKGRKREQSSSRQFPYQCRSNLSKCDTPKNDKRRRVTFTRSLHDIEQVSGCLPEMKDAPQAIRLDDSRSKKGQAIVLDDEDETFILEKECQEKKLDECLNEAKIYYPSRDDPKCVEICYRDIDCLAPEGFLTSTIMNFYIRYLQQQASVTDRSISDYHFFNTYFYKKLKEAVSYKRSDRDTFFAKFRRWWKGTNIFQKAYILIPIHEDLHWSLVIISFPEKKDESGPIILHLDSLSLHSSRSVFENVKSFLKEEWKYVDREYVPSDIPIADKIWKYLPRRIEDKILEVPQQKNEYDCGLFVLYFIKRFIEEAPERLKKKDLNMFGKKWFKPEEASSLRVKIRNLLKEEFQNSCKNMSSAVTPPECVKTDKDS
ncbi:ubiquitin-like-specific protease 1D isoform X1 [Prosopis cineraria]|uniref:ubiquitin-like-specific protease 1D isoform X1 n=1 Tax=Prosopis cineraria TaxID=364024 RepID=UPI00240F9D5D|nr:ubiquitin-like-specific protease 1D isoform X1 [Prosopis cineraria]